MSKITIADQNLGPAHTNNFELSESGSRSTTHLKGSSFDERTRGKKSRETVFSLTAY
jgi:hypothetical protein